MPPASAEARLLLLLHQRRVVKQADLAEHLHVSAKGVQRLLCQVGCYHSLNHNAAFVTLTATARFDDSGLWTCDGVCFSRHGDLALTLLFLIEQSPDGQTRRELEGKVHTHVHNQLSALVRRRAIASFVLDRHAVYTSAQPPRRQRQEEARRPPPPPVPAPLPLLPPGMDCLAVLRVLRRLLQAPQASAAALAKSLQTHQLSVTAEQVRHLMAFYGIKKTTR
jgi:hypothetical protein